MPLKLRLRLDKSPNYEIRGTYLRQPVERSTGTSVKALANQILKRVKEEIEQGRLNRPGEPTFLSAALDYVKAGGENRFVGTYDEETKEWSLLIGHFRDTPLRLIDQQAIDKAALAVYPKDSGATRNRQVYTPVSAILKHAGVKIELKRPRGAQGRVMVHWLWPPQVHALAAAAGAIDAELETLTVLLVATGLRIGEALGIKCQDIRIADAFIFVGMTKNGEPRPVHLPPDAVEALKAHPRGIARGEARLFRWTKCGLLYLKMKEAFEKAELDHGGQPFHILRHTYGSWMRRYAGLDDRGMADAGAWKDKKSAARYTHTIVSESARKSDMLPVRKKETAE